MCFVCQNKKIRPLGFKPYFICFCDRGKQTRWRFDGVSVVHSSWLKCSKAAFSVQSNVKKAANLQLISNTLSKEIILRHLEYKWSFVLCQLHRVHSVNMEWRLLHASSWGFNHHCYHSTLNRYLFVYLLE